MAKVCVIWPRLNINTVFPRYGIPILKIRRSRDRLIFIMGIPMLVRQHLYIEAAPGLLLALSGRVCNLWKVDGSAHVVETVRRDTSETLSINVSRLPSNLSYKSRLSRQLNCWSLRCSWRCFNYISIFDLTLDFNRLHKDNCKTRRETFKFYDLEQFISEIWWYIRLVSLQLAFRVPLTIEMDCVQWWASLS